jgi:hypothetical protein
MKSVSLIFVVIVSLWSGVSCADGEYFLYKNCADQGRGAPLIGCANAEIGKKLDNLRINHFLEASIPVRADPEGGKVLNSAVIPVVIPPNYTAVDGWSYENRRYFKSAKKFAVPFSDEKVDVIVVVDHVDTIQGGNKLLSLDSPDAKAMFTFWYSERLGVLAFGLPQEGNSGDVYYCATAPCLFSSSR